MDVKARLAVLGDVPALATLTRAAIAALLPQFLNPAEVEASYALMGLDTQLIEDGTYFVLENTLENTTENCPAILGCGGWSRRATLFGGDQTDGRDARHLDPKTEPARVRAMYTHPLYVRRGLARQILALCENAARAEGFRRVELAATMAGQPLYEACGYHPIERMSVPAPSGICVPILRMGKAL